MMIDWTHLKAHWMTAGLLVKTAGRGALGGPGAA